MKRTALHQSGGLLMGAVIALFAAEASAVPMLYTNRAAFDAAVAGISGVSADVLDFEAPAAGTIFPSGNAHQGVTFTYNLGAFQLGVDGNTPGSSGAHTLAVSNNNGTNFSNFILGDVIDFSFGPSHAFGMYILAPGTSFNFIEEDINLTFAGTTLSTVTGDTTTLVGPSNVAALFVGIVDTAATYTTANLRFGPANPTSGPNFEIDDIVKTSEDTEPPPTGLPEPGLLSLLGVGMMGMALARRKRPA